MPHVTSLAQRLRTHQSMTSGEDVAAWGEQVEALGTEVIRRGNANGWVHQCTQPQQGHLVILHKPNPNGGVRLMKLNIWCSTGTVGSFLKHPNHDRNKRNPAKALFRLPITTWSELDEILKNPRVHTGKGYHRRSEKAKKVAKQAEATPERATYHERGDAAPSETHLAKPKSRARLAARPAQPNFAPAADGATMRGTVRFFDARVKFFGFITAEDGSEVYVHRNRVKKGHRLYPGTKVEFEVRATGKRNPEAAKVRAVA